ncbi:MAG TPA: hydrogenase formation protein HypD, partial [Deltaproteobacteria bacterium]|nr:hydrogenase formation protein HypD [Deltaproteobacteria bacterium]
MKYIDEYRDPALAKALLGRIENAAGALGRDIAIMEVCGSHTQAIGRYGIRKMLPAHIRLISGPGCPVCVTSIHDVDTDI